MKKGRLLFQIGLLLVLIFVIILLSAEYYMMKKSQDLFLEAKNEMIDKNLEYAAKNIKPYVNRPVIKYMVDHIEELKFDAYSEENFMETLRIISEQEDSTAEDWEFFGELDEKSKLLYANLTRSLIESGLASSISDSKCQGVSVYVPVDDNHLITLANSTMGFLSYDFSSSETDAKADTEAEDDKYYYGQVYEFDWSHVKGLSEAIANKQHKAIFHKEETDEYGVVYSGFRPVYDEEDNLALILYIEYDWTDVYSDMLTNLREKMARDFLIAITIAVVLILVSIYLVALRPLRKVKKTLDNYMETKDSDEVENALSDFKVKNEIGTLAEGVVEFSREIEQYTADNIVLASETAKVQTELELAAAIQSGALIDEFPNNDQYEVFASMNPAKEVGGDFYDVFELDENHVCLVIADVSGKGLPAALMMMAAMTSIRNYAHHSPIPSEIITKVNNDLCERHIMDMFVTIWIGVFDLKTGILISSNAGHENPAVNISGKYELLRDKHSLVAGGMKGIKYFDCAVQLKKGNSIFVYTDGVPEATNGDMKMFRDERMLDALNIEPDAEPTQLLKNVKTAVDEFVGEAEQFDDLTMLCLKYK